ncbi:hypothetical protein ACIBJI_23900 [Nocardia sp. NPDC050408]|uniref:hypothetical protein n=1 Tax=Nocardia sp. NPDC050408 TaxID=3364319 RepID=UPI0037B5CC16
MTDDDMPHQHVTECDGLEASWTLDKHNIEIHGIYDTAEDLLVVSIDGPYPDLVEARERWPKLTDLWNAVRHDFWSQMTSHAYGRSTKGRQ